MILSRRQLNFCLVQYLRYLPPLHIRTRPLLFQRYLRSRSVRLLYRLRPHPGVNRPPHDVITPQNPPADSLQHLVLQPEASSKTAQNGRIKESSPLLLLLLLNSRSLLSPSLTSPLIQAQPQLR
ncbi:hypothetical protein HZS61_001184 [Fusarium oxysporum f. sp. conglutinans]|uniref:Uncharacterized protein n=1 Tax=Fusarium oxysporum f. sp. conglutinans TaxID=100902 RepID=A0A8H6H414_FUSOX|nr:hypothetical protein HZS61_001184 [Fusarium oxysporum f. sp. conglutinans]